MSWQAFADSIVASRNATYSVIASCLASGGYGVLAASGQIQPTPQEIEVLVKRLETPNTGEKLIIGGMSFGATKCSTEYLVGRDMARGICVAKSNNALVVGVYGEGQYPGNCLSAVLKLVDTLKAGNY